ncbi:hypothetical protein KAF25_011103 [Fusarium avenaceum]|uniref:Uncharacterized protein n=1 Tax=Fusarium avenaceum TaxID=40199 RepID=A0A9P7GU81_9HYPO|nr:hypothetical protein KAF25_011103 [Fusarium avenaceum]
MVSTSWDPQAGAELKFKNALQSIKGLTQKATELVPGSNPAREKEFLLNARGYQDIQAYLSAAIALPATESDFSRTFISKSSSAKIDDVDNGVVPFLQKTTKEVQNRCLKFRDSDLSEMVNVASDVKAFASQAQKYLSESGRISIKAKLKIIYDPKYKDGTSDDEMKDAIASIKLVLESLAKNSRLKEERIDKSVKKIETFLLGTRGDQTNVQFIQQLFWTGPVVDVTTKKEIKEHNGVKVESYSKYLDAEYTRISQDVQQKIKDKEEELRDNRLKLGVWLGAGWVLFPIWGLVLPAAIATQVDIAKELEVLMEQRKSASREASEVQNLIGTTATMEKQFSLLLQGMEKALAALKELQTMFNSQAHSFDSAAMSCTDALDALDESWATRKEWLEEWVDTTTEEWKHIAEAIQKFMDYKDITIAPA